MLNIVENHLFFHLDKLCLMHPKMYVFFLAARLQAHDEPAVNKYPQVLFAELLSSHLTLICVWHYSIPSAEVAVFLCWITCHWWLLTLPIYLDSSGIPFITLGNQHLNIISEFAEDVLGLVSRSLIRMLNRTGPIIGLGDFWGWIFHMWPDKWWLNTWLNIIYNFI